jgi:hypothetical protein
MYAFNVVRFRVRPGLEQAFVEAHSRIQADMPGLYRAALVRTGDRTFCFVGEWDSMNHIVEARPAMIGVLDQFRHMLEDLGAELGVTDPVSGEVVAEIAPRKVVRPAAKAKPRKPARKPAKKAAKKKPAKKKKKR